MCHFFHDHGACLRPDDDASMLDALSRGFSSGHFPFTFLSFFSFSFELPFCTAVRSLRH